MYNVFIDGKEGTTGLQIFDRLGMRKDVNVISLSEEKRKDVSARKEAINAADIVFLCLPDGAAKEAVGLVESDQVRVIDASTAHRTASGWAYGFPELSAEHRSAIARSRFIANPGCYASGFIALVRPLVKRGIVSASYPFVCHAVSGYSGAGKKGIAQYEAEVRDAALETPRLYGLTLSHKHLPEMVAQCALSHKPIFNPYICDYYSGMSVSVPLYEGLLEKKLTVKELRDVYREQYADAYFVHVGEETDGYIAANPFNGTNHMEILVHGNEEQVLLTAVFDNLGKGASGAAVQNMNIALGLDEKTGLA